jgi:hypothetical protein
MTSSSALMARQGWTAWRCTRPLAVESPTSSRLVGHMCGQIVSGGWSNRRAAEDPGHLMPEILRSESWRSTSGLDAPRRDRCYLGG